MASGVTKINEDTDSPSSVQADLESFIKAVITTYQSLNGVTVLHHELDDKNKVESGRNFTTGIVQLKLKYQKNEEECQSSVIIKIPHYSPLYDNLKKLGLYEKEAYMYETVFARMYDFWPHESITPTCYGASLSGLLALENLQDHGFQMRSKNMLLDLTECKEVLENLGKFHAITFKYLQVHGTEEFDLKMNYSYSRGGQGQLVSLLSEKIGKHLASSLSKDHLGTWLEFVKNSEASLDVASNSHNAGGLQVILHGDLQSNNLLWKKNECKFIDFQISRRGPPSLDVIYLLLTSVKLEMLKEHREDALKYYIAALNGTLEQLDCAERYSIASLKEDFGKYKGYSFYILSFIIPVLWSEVGSDFLGRLAGDESTEFDKVVQSARYISLFKSWMDVILN